MKCRFQYNQNILILKRKNLAMKLLVERKSVRVTLCIVRCNGDVKITFTMVNYCKQFTRKILLTYIAGIHLAMDGQWFLATFLHPCGQMSLFCQCRPFINSILVSGFYHILFIDTCMLTPIGKF